MTLFPNLIEQTIVRYLWKDVDSIEQLMGLIDDDSKLVFIQEYVYRNAIYSYDALNYRKFVSFDLFNEQKKNFWSFCYCFDKLSGTRYLISKISKSRKINNGKHHYFIFINQNLQESESVVCRVKYR